MSTIEKALNALKAKQANQGQKQTSIEKAEAQQRESNATAETTPTEQALIEEGRVKNEELVISNELLNQKGMISSSRQSRKIRDEYRHIKLKLLHHAFGSAASAHDKGNLIMVTSANPGDGKTFTSINLALSIALEQDKTVLLVDADVLKPSVMKVLELKNRAGLMEYLSGEAKSVADVIHPTNIPNLRIMPAGLPHDLSNELLTSAKMATLAQELADRYPDRVVVFDSPPLLGINETKVMSSLVGQAIIVVQQDTTKMTAIEDAISELDRNLAIGFVMNKVVRGALGLYGYGGYGYGYGYGYGDAESQA